MRHRVAHRKLGRVTEHRIALLRNQAEALLRHEHIETTVPEGEGTAAVRRAADHDRQARRGRAARRPAQGAARAAPGRRGHPRTARSSTSCSTRWRRGSRAGPAATPASSGSATAAATRRDGADRAGGQRVQPEGRREGRRGRREGAKARRRSAAGCAPPPRGSAARRRTRRATAEQTAKARTKAAGGEAKKGQHAAQGRRRRRIRRASSSRDGPQGDAPRGPSRVRAGSRPTPLPRLLALLGLGRRDDLRLQVRRHFLVVRVLHLVGATAAGRRRELLLVGEHLGHRHLRLDHRHRRRACPCRRCGRAGCSGRPSGRPRTRSARRPRRS